MKISTISNVFFGILFLISTGSVAMESNQISLDASKNILSQWIKALGTMTGELTARNENRDSKSLEKIDLLILGSSLGKTMCQELLAQNPDDAELIDTKLSMEESITLLSEARLLAEKAQIRTQRLAQAAVTYSNMTADQDLKSTLDNLEKVALALAPGHTELMKTLERMKLAAKEISDKKSQLSGDNYSLQVMEKKVGDYLEELKQVNKTLYTIIDQQEIQKQLSFLCNVLPEKVQLTDQGKERCENLKVIPIIQKKEEDEISEAQNRHKQLTAQSKVFFEQIENDTEQQFKSALLDKVNQSTDAQEAKKCLENLWEIYRSLPAYRDLYLCEEAEVESILFKNHEILGLDEEEVRPFVSEQPFNVRRKNFVKIFEGYQRIHQEFLEKYCK